MILLVENFLNSKVLNPREELSHPSQGTLNSLILVYRHDFLIFFLFLYQFPYTYLKVVLTSLPVHLFKDCFYINSRTSIQRLFFTSIQHIVLPFKSLLETVDRQHISFNIVRFKFLSLVLETVDGQLTQ